METTSSLIMETFSNLQNSTDETATNTFQKDFDVVQNDTETFHHIVPVYIRTPVIIVVSVLIISSNIINLITLHHLKQLPKVARILFINMSAADLVVGLVTCLPCVYPSITGVWPYGDIWCQISGALHGTSCSISIWSIASISLDRCIACSFPLYYKTQHSGRVGYIWVVVLWIVGLITFISPILTKNNFIYYKYHPVEILCGLDWEYPMFAYITGLYIPILSAIVLVVTSVIISRKVSNKGRSVRSSLKSNSFDKRVVKILSLTAVAYFTLWGPYVIKTCSVALVPGGFPVPELYTFVVVWLANSNSGVNVVIYSILNPSFRRMALSLIKCSCERDTVSENSTENRDGTVSSVTEDRK